MIRSYDLHRPITRLRVAVLLSVLVTGSVGCATSLQVIEPEKTRTLVPFIQVGHPKSAILEKFGESWSYSASPESILVYRMKHQGQEVLVVAQDNDADADYEFVLVFDKDEHLRRYSLIRVK